MKDDRVYLRHILDCADFLETIKNDGYETFIHDRKTRDAALRNLQTLTETTQLLTEAVKLRWSAVPWKAIASFRNVVTHNYLGLNYQRVWVIIQEDVAALAATVRDMLVILDEEATKEAGEQ